MENDKTEQQLLLEVIKKKDTPETMHKAVLKAARIWACTLNINVLSLQKEIDICCNVEGHEASIESVNHEVFGLKIKDIRYDLMRIETFISLIGTKINEIFDNDKKDNDDALQ